MYKNRYRSIVVWGIILTLQVTTILPYILACETAYVQAEDVSAENMQKEVKNAALMYCDLYQKSFVDLMVADMSDIVKETEDTYLYTQMLYTDIEKAKVFETGYRDYQLEVKSENVKKITNQTYNVQIIFDLQYHYQNAPEIPSALYGVEYNFVIERQNDGKWMIVKIASEFDEFDAFKSEVEDEMSQCILENGMFSDVSDRKKIIQAVSCKEIKEIPAEEKMCRTMEEVKKEVVDLEQIQSALNQGEGDATIQKAAKKSYAYNASKGVQYASQFASKSNPKDLIFYYANGGDCTNFVSQCVWAAYGGYDAGSITNSKKNRDNQIRMVSGKWYGGSGGGAGNWEGVENFWKYTTKKKAVGPNGSRAGIDGGIRKNER